MMRKSVLTLLIFTLILLPLSTKGFVVNNSKVYIDVNITSGYYTDAEGDGIENDVITTFEMYFNADDDLDDLFKDRLFDMTLSLSLPSGFMFSYTYTEADLAKILETSYDLDEEHLKVALQVNFWDHALESGDYTFTIEMNLDIDDKSDHSSYWSYYDDEYQHRGFYEYDEVLYGITSLTFDPPGSTSGPPPLPSLLARV